MPCLHFSGIYVQALRPGINLAEHQSSQPLPSLRYTEGGDPMMKPPLFLTLWNSLARYTCISRYVSIYLYRHLYKIHRYPDSSWPLNSRKAEIVVASSLLLLVVSAQFAGTMEYLHLRISRDLKEDWAFDK